MEVPNPSQDQILSITSKLINNDQNSSKPTTVKTKSKWNNIYSVIPKILFKKLQNYTST